MVELLLVHQFEVAVVCRPEDGVCDVLPENLGDPLCDPLLDLDCIEAEDVIPVGFSLPVDVDRNLWLDVAVFGAGALGSRS